jgi:putative cross-wall-targeting lipoprotein signal
MEKYLDKNLHGRGYFRKTKQWGLACGIALAGAIVFGSQSASADEVTAQPSVKEAESVVVANKVDDNSVAKQTTAETNSKAQTVVENKDVKSTTSEVKAATNQEGLNKKYESIKELAKKESVVTKETEKVNHETIDLANKDLAKQEQAIKDVAKQNAELNSQLKKAIDEAKKSNINVTLDKTVTHETVDAAKKDIDKQVAQIEKLVSLVSDAKARISKSLEETSKVGVKFEGKTEIVLTPGKESEFEASVSGAEKTLADLKNKQVTLTNLLNSLSEKAKAGGVEVTKGKTVVLDEKEVSELAKKTTEKVELAISDTKFNKDNYEKALAEWNKAVADAKAKVEADYNKALDEFNKKVAEAKSKNEQIKAENEKLAKDSSSAKSQLTKDSTATKNQDGSYNQILKAVAKASSTTTTASSEAIVTITPEKGVKLISAELVSPSGKKQVLEVKDNKVSFKGPLTENGEYKVLYSFNSTVNNETSINSSFVVSGKEQSTTSQNKTVQAPMDLIAMVDASPSYSGLSSSIFPLLKEMMKDANPKSRMAFFATGVNEENSHVIKKDEATKWLPMSDANKFIDLVIEKMNKREREGWSDKYSSNWFFDVIKEHPEFAIDESYDKEEIEVAHKNLKNKNKIFNVIQVTDGWSQNEGMDTSFAEYVKNNAKTFVSVIQASGKNDFTTNKMKAVGLPNTMNLSPIEDIDKIVAKFKETATETVVVKSEEKGFTNSDTKLDKFIPVTLGKPENLVEIPNNAPKKGEVKTPEKPKAPKALSVEIPEVQLKAKGVKIGEVETKAHEVSVETKIHPVSYTEPKVVVKEGKVLPHTGEALSASLLVAGLGVAGLASLVLSKKKQEN